MSSHDSIPLVVEINGEKKTFPSRAAAARAFGILKTTLLNRLKYGWTPEEAVGIVTKSDRGRRMPVVVVHNGEKKTFDSRRAASRAFGICNNTVDNRLKAGWTNEEALGIVRKTGTCVVCGETFLHPEKGMKPDKIYCSEKCKDTTRDRDHANAMRRKRRKANPEKYRAKERLKSLANLESRRRWAREHRKRNLNKLRKYNIDYARRRLNEDPYFRTKKQLRDRFSRAVNGGYKNGSAVRDLGCSVEEFHRFIESKFTDGMTWENKGQFGWHYDHIIPLSSFDLTDREQCLKALHFSNYQPLWWRDNLSKGSKVDT